MRRVARLGDPEGPRMIDGAARAIGDAPHAVMQHLVIDDALEEVEGDVAPVEDRVDADQPEDRVVAPEGEPAAPRAPAPPAPCDRDPQGALEETRVQPLVDPLQVVDAPPGEDGRKGPLHLPHAVQVLVHEPAHGAIGLAAAPRQPASDRTHDGERRVEEHPMEPDQHRVPLPPEREEHRAVLREGQAHRANRFAREGRLEARGVPQRRIEWERELTRRKPRRRTHRKPGDEHGKANSRGQATRSPLRPLRRDLRRSDLRREDGNYTNCHAQVAIVSPSTPSARSTGSPCPSTGPASAGRPCPRSSGRSRRRWC